MNDVQSVFLATESGKKQLDEIVMGKILEIVNPKVTIKGFSIGTGKDAVLSSETWGKVRGAARSEPVLMMLDLDEPKNEKTKSNECVKSFLEKLKQDGKLPEAVPDDGNVHLFFAVREVERWLLADVEGFSKWSGVDEDEVTKMMKIDLEGMTDDKAKMAMMEAELKMTDVDETTIDFVAKKGGDPVKKKAKKAKKDGDGNSDWRAAKRDFAENGWDPVRAMENSASLKRTIEKLKEILD